MKQFRLLFYAVLISSIGVWEIFRINNGLGEKQLFFVILSIIIFFLMKTVNLKKIMHLPYVFYAAGIIFAIAPLVLSKGHIKRWIYVSGIQFQPSEVAKIFYIFFIASFYNDAKRRSGQGFIKALLLSLVYFGLVFMEPDLATSASFLFIFFVVSYIAGVPMDLLFLLAIASLAGLTSFSKIAFLILLIVVTIYIISTKHALLYVIILYTSVITVGLATPIAWNRVLKPYQRARIISFLDIEKHRMESGWQVYQAEIAMGSAGLWGKTNRKFSQKNLKFLPAPHTDFIFSSIGEDAGFIGLFVITLLYILFLRELTKDIKKVKRIYVKLFAAGVFSYFVYHIIFNIASNIGFFPVAGIPLAFLSYGGSHILVEYTLTGLTAWMLARGQ